MLYNSNEIQQIIPHRYPFLLVDQVESIDEENKIIVAKKNVSANEIIFMGHFPDKHVFPGVLIVEALAQAGAILLLSQKENKGKIAYFAGIDKMRFSHPVIPGDTLILTAELIKNKASIYWAKVEAKVNNKRVASGEIMCGVK